MCKLSESSRSFVAIVISALALAVSAFQWHSSNQNSKIAVQPLLDWRTEYNRPDENTLFEIRIVNAGLGPAKVSDLSLVIDGQKLDGLNFKNCDLVDIKLGVTDPNAFLNNICWTMPANEEVYLRADEEIVLYRLGWPREGEFQLDSFTDEAFGVFAKYESFYGDRYTLE